MVGETKEQRDLPTIARKDGINVTLEPAEPKFVRKPSKNAPDRRTTTFLLVNHSSSKLIFKITPSKPDKYTIKPMYDYLLPRAVRLITIHFDDKSLLGKKHEFSYHMHHLAINEGYGQRAEDLWTKKNLDESSDYQVHDGKFSCSEHDIQEPIRSLSTLSASESATRIHIRERPGDISIGHFKIERAPGLTVSDILEPQPPQLKERTRVKTQQKEQFAQKSVTDDQTEFVRYECHEGKKFWQSAMGMRAFCFGFLSGTLVIGFLLLK